LSVAGAVDGEHHSRRLLLKQTCRSEFQSLENDGHGLGLLDPSAEMERPIEIVLREVREETGWPT